MRLLLIILLTTVIVQVAHAQDASETKRERLLLSRSDWQEMLAGIARDTAVVRQLASFDGTPILLENKPQICFGASQFPLAVVFCPECTWVVDSSEREGVAISASEYGMHMRHVISNRTWNPGDTVAQVFLVTRSDGNPLDHCTIIPAASAIPKRRIR